MNTAGNWYWHPTSVAITVDSPETADALILAVIGYGKSTGAPVTLNSGDDALIEFGEEYIRRCCVRVNGLSYDDAMTQLLNATGKGNAYRTVVQRVNDRVESRLYDAMSRYQ